MPMLANENWHNSHNFYGELADLEAATVADATDFFKSFYRPNNAVLVVAGDIDYAQTRRWIDRYFSSVPRGEPVKLPDISEPRQTQEKFRIKPDKLAPRPAFTAAWHVPKRNTPEWFAMGLLDQILVQGQDSRLVQKLVRETGIASGIQGGMNIGLGNMYNYNGPMLWTGRVHPRSLEEPAGDYERARQRHRGRSEQARQCRGIGAGADQDPLQPLQSRRSGHSLRSDRFARRSVPFGKMIPSG
jgi:hypothetical protein